MKSKKNFELKIFLVGSEISGLYVESPLDLIISLIKKLNFIGTIKVQSYNQSALSSFYKLDAFYVRFG